MKAGFRYSLKQFFTSLFYESLQFLLVAEHLSDSSFQRQSDSLSKAVFSLPRHPFQNRFSCTKHIWLLIY